MQQEVLMKTMEEGFKKAEEMVIAKGQVYHHHEDRLSHIKATAAATGLSTERSIHALVSKHFTALPDMLDNQGAYSADKFDEYFIDILVYISYLRAVVLENKNYLVDAVNKIAQAEHVVFPVGSPKTKRVSNELG